MKSEDCFKDGATAAWLHPENPDRATIPRAAPSQQKNPENSFAPKSTDGPSADRHVLFFVIFDRPLRGGGVRLVLLGDFNKSVEVLGTVDRDFAKHLAIDLDICLKQPVNKAAVVDVAHTTGRR